MTEKKINEDTCCTFATLELSEEKVEAISASRVDPRHAHLDAILDE